MPTKPKGWSITALSRETGLDRATVSKVLANVKPIGKDGRATFYSLGQFIKAHVAYHTRDSEALDLKREQALYYRSRRLEIDEKRENFQDSFISSADVINLLETIAAAQRRVVMKSKLSPQEQDAFIRQIEALKDDFAEPKPDDDDQ